jgi:hypothetical protein
MSNTDTNKQSVGEPMELLILREHLGVPNVASVSGLFILDYTFSFLSPVFLKINFII